LVTLANLQSPFEENTIVETASKIKAYLDSIDDTKL
jgi:hypothetical protein